MLLMLVLTNAFKSGGLMTTCAIIVEEYELPALSTVQYSDTFYKLGTAQVSVVLTECSN